MLYLYNQKMSEVDKHYIFIDLQNLHLSTKNQGFLVDLKRLKIFLKDSYGINKFFIFIGFLESNKKFYNFIKKTGYEIIFKKTVSTQHSIKGNCDVDLTLETMKQLKDFNRASFITGDGDFVSLFEYLDKINKLCIIIVPDKSKYSTLYKKGPLRKKIRFLNDFKNKIKKRPHEDETS